MRKLILSVALCLGLPPVAGHAQSGEIFIPGTDPLVEIKPQPQSQMAGCLLNPNAANCSGIDIDPDGIALESAGPSVTFETLVLDLDTKKVVVSKVPPPEPPKYDAPEPPKTGKVALPSVAVTIEFDYDSDRVRGDQRGKIDSLIAALNDPALQGTSYAVIGHTDAVGSEGYNCDLSLRRAASVTRLIEGAYLSVPLYPVGWGEYVLKNEYDPRAAENRRVTFLRLPNTPGAVLQTASTLCRY
ncbi:OmpA family protein [Antarctobacter heliothermus]|uniref:Outer membrane protein OmpA n=1 Tax=Antarctobacter heliothermus TaxID=74033 RepID=A0A239DT08_9RHOB|nr:OmpA family protein [Antarctobacter heliothermus]SNS34883.1 Outer membrane protein OmpA [Antarctobacter heliothermus]